MKTNRLKQTRESVGVMVLAFTVATVTAIMLGSHAMNSSTQPFVAAAGVSQGQGTTSTIGRKVNVDTVLNPLFSAAVVTRSNFNMNGNGTTVDSFDSGNTNYSTGGQYDASKRESNGDVATDSSIVNSLGLGNGNIYGHVMTGPGTVQSSVQVGAGGGIGTAAWQASN
jgi:hypothetical protein